MITCIGTHIFIDINYLHLWDSNLGLSVARVTVENHSASRVLMYWKDRCEDHPQTITVDEHRCSIGRVKMTNAIPPAQPSLKPSQSFHDHKTAVRLIKFPDKTHNQLIIKPSH